MQINSLNWHTRLQRYPIWSSPTQMNYQDYIFAGKGKHCWKTSFCRLHNLWGWQQISHMGKMFIGEFFTMFRMDTNGDSPRTETDGGRMGWRLTINNNTSRDFDIQLRSSNPGSGLFKYILYWPLRWVLPYMVTITSRSKWWSKAPEQLVLDVNSISSMAARVMISTSEP